MERYERVERRRKHKSDVEAAATLIEISKYPRQTTDDRELTELTQSDDEVLQLRQEVVRLQEANDTTRVENVDLQRDLDGLLECSEETVAAVQLQSLRSENSQLSDQVLHLQSEVDRLKSEVETVKFGAKNLANKNARTRFYTGLPTFNLFVTLFILLKPFADTSASSRSIALIDEYFVVLVKLRLGLMNSDLAYRVNVSECSISRIFHKWLDIMYVNLKQLIVWPDPDALHMNLPEAFKKHYSRAKWIIDCFEIFIERPVSFLARATTYSNYKKHNTVKVLIAASPTGSVCFISKALGGRGLDKVITQQCGFLDYIGPGDIVLADRGFNIHDDVAIRGGKLDIPIFTKGK